MSQIYSNPKRENDPYSLPDVETFYHNGQEDETMGELALVDGWYYWPCFAGCLPDSDPIGPFDTEAEAIADAQSDAWQFDDDDD